MRLMLLHLTPSGAYRFLRQTKKVVDGCPTFTSPYASSPLTSFGCIGDRHPCGNAIGKGLMCSNPSESLDAELVWELLTETLFKDRCNRIDKILRNITVV